MGIRYIYEADTSIKIAETNEKQRRDRENRQLRQILEKSEMQKEQVSIQRLN